MAATGHAVRSLVSKALDAAGKHAPGAAARAEQLQVAAKLLGPLLLRRELSEVQQQYPIPALHFTVDRIDLVHAHGAVNGLLAAAARQVRVVVGNATFRSWPLPGLLLVYHRYSWYLNCLVTPKPCRETAGST
jgi:hypothetical protein